MSIDNFKSFLNEKRSPVGSLFRKTVKKKAATTKEEMVQACGYKSTSEYEKDISILNKYSTILRLGKFTKSYNIGSIQNVKNVINTYLPYIEDLEAIKLNLSEISDSGYLVNIFLQNLGAYGGSPVPTFGFTVQIKSKKEVNPANAHYQFYEEWFSTEEVIDIMECLQVAEGRLETKFCGLNVNQQYINLYIIPEDFVESMAQQQRAQQQNQCPTCFGNGDAECNNCHGNGCDDCHGEGYVDCPQCHGAGTIN